ncbi:MAG: hypothetical protein QXY11_03785 [Desulfurococcaceae archaeon]
MHSSNKCVELMTYPNHYVTTDLIELESRSLDELLKDAKELNDNLKTFMKECRGRTASPQLENLVISKYHLALLKYSTALEEKLKNTHVQDEFAQYIINRYTQDEKNVLRELEKFSKLDPEITSHYEIAEMIVAESGEIYELIKEAVNKEYLNWKKILETWQTKLKIRNELIPALDKIYQARFENIVNAIKLLLDQHPGWIKRLFKEYEDALLKSAEVREMFEEKLKEVLSKEVTSLEKTLRTLEEENSSLRRRLEELSARLILTEDEKKKRDEELLRIKYEYETLKSRYEFVLVDFSKKLSELEKLKNTLVEKERELEKLKAAHDASRAEKQALENEIAQLRKTISEYEKIVQDYRLLESRVKELESALKGELTGNLVRREEVDFIYEVIANKARSMLENDEVRLFDPRESKYTTIKKWDAINKFTSVKRVGEPLSIRSIAFTKLTGVLYKKKDVVIEYALVTHLLDTGGKEFDSQVVSLADFTLLWRDRVKEAEEDEHYHVLIVISPTGFDKELIDYVTGSSTSWMSLSSKYVTTYLVDPLKGKLYYNANDPLAKNNSFLANISLPEEQIEKVVNYMLSNRAKIEAAKRNPATPFLALRDISAATGVTDELVLRRALSILEEKYLGKVKIMDNEVVFAYEAYLCE